MKSILISIKPKWVAKILNGEKTIEIRKSMPKCDLPIDVYIYCTKEKPKAILTDKGCVVANTLIVGGNSQYKSGYSLSGQIVGKFTLNKVDIVWKTINEEHPKHLLENSCLSFEELHSYLNGSIGYAWQIDDLEIFNELKELRDFKKTNKFGVPQYEFGNGTCDYKKIKKAPQSWCYIEVE